MTPEEVFRRRLLSILAKKRPELSETEREEIVEVVLLNVDPRGDLTYFWKGFYGVTA